MTPTVPNSPRSILVAATLAMVLLVLDSTIVGVMLATIQRDLGLTSTRIAWVVSSYLLALAVFLPLGGRITDAIGAGTAYSVGMLGFVVASAGIGLADSELTIVAWRSLAGVAAALLLPASLTIITNTFEGQARAPMMAVFTGVGQGFAVVGPIIGGVLAEFWTWRMGFLINIPVGLIGFGLMLRARPLNTRKALPRWDVVGTVALIVGISGVVVALLQLPQWGIASLATWVIFAAGVLFLAVFVWRSLVVEHPIVNLRIFAIRSFSAGTLVLFCLGFGMTVAAIYGALALQEALGLSAAASGVALLPMVLPLLIATRWVGRSYHALGPRQIGIVGSLVLAAGLMLAALGFGFGSVVLVCIGLVPVGIGVGLLLSPMTTATLSVVDEGERGTASGTISAARQLGSILGVAVLSALVAMLAPVFGQGLDSGASTIAPGVTAGFAIAAAVMVVAALGALTGFPRRERAPTTLAKS